MVKYIYKKVYIKISVLFSILSHRIAQNLFYLFWQIVNFNYKKKVTSQFYVTEQKINKAIIFGEYFKLKI